MMVEDVPIEKDDDSVELLFSKALQRQDKVRLRLEFPSYNFLSFVCEFAQLVIKKRTCSPTMVSKRAEGAISHIY